MNRKELIKRLDRICQTCSRYRGAVKKPNGEIVNQCITCGRVMPVAKLDGGHFIPRGCHALRWDEYNVNPQCQSCNRFRDGAYIEYSKWMIDKYGKEMFDEMVETKQKSKAGKIKPYSILELRAKYNAWLVTARIVEQDYNVKLFPKSWEFEEL